MSAKTLDEFGIFKSEKEEAKPSLQHPEEAAEGSSRGIPIPEAVKELSDSYLVSATYNGQKRAVLLKLYEPKTKTLHFWYDNTGHQPYLLTNLPPEELAKISKVVSHPGLDHFELVKKYDPLNDQEVTLTKVVVKDPLAVGGRVNSLREVIPSERPDAKVWEADIKYYECFIYDRGLIPGMLYKIVDGQLIQADFKPPFEILKTASLLFKDEHPEIRETIENWINLLECPLPEFKRVAVDIEVGTDVPTRVPDPHKAEYPVIAVSLVGSDGLRRVLLLKPRPKPIPEVGEGSEKLAVTPEYYSNEKELIAKVYEVLREYPFVITFNGDDFDLRYLCHRGENLGIKEDQNPIELGKEFALIKTGVHIDLYKFFFNRSIQTYAFGQRYRDITLDDIGVSLLGVGKIFSEKPISELTYTELANYCLRDAELTYQLTAFNDNLVMKLIMIIARIAKMPMEDVTRTGISQWIRSLLNFEHRRRNWLIPRPEDLLELKGMTATKPIIKGKKYKGATVFPPSPGIHFNVPVLDFASVDSDEPIIVRREGEEGFHQMKVGEFVDDILPSCDDLPLQVMETKHWEVLCFDKDGKIKFKPIIQVSRHKWQGNLLRIKTSDGRSIRVTPNHSLFRLNENLEVVPVKVGELRKGDFIIVPKKVCFPIIYRDKINLLDLLKTMPDEKTEPLILIYNYSRLSTQWRKTASTPLQKIMAEKLYYRDSRYRRLIFRFNDLKPYLHLIQPNELHNWSIHLRGKKFKMRGTPCKLVLPLRNFAKFLGYYLSEGSIRSTNDSIVIAQKKSLQRREDIFNCLTQLGFPFSCQNVGAVLSKSHFLSYLLTSCLEAGRDAYTKAIPNFLFFTDETTKMAFLKAYLNGDGWRYPSGYAFKTSSKQLANDLMLFLLSLGKNGITINENPEKIDRPRKHGKRSITDQVTSYTVYVNDNWGDVNRFHNRHPSYLYPLPLLPQAIRESLPCKSSENVKKVKFLEDCCAVLKSLDNHILEKLPEEPINYPINAYWKKLYSFLSSELHISKVEDIEECPPSNGYVYDIGVSETNSFVSGLGWICAHNSLYPSIIKKYNLSYETILCRHEECRNNKIPDTPHWVCTKRRGISSLLIGSLRDLRVKWYKVKAKDKQLSPELRNLYNVIQLVLKVFLNASVDYCEPVILQNQCGDVNILRIGEFVDQQLKENGYFITPEGAEISRPNGWRALCFNPKTNRMVYAPIKAVIRHRYDGDLIFIKTKSGREIRVTPSHSLFKLDRDTATITPVETDDLRVGDYIIVPIKAPQTLRVEKYYNLLKALTQLPSSEKAEIYVHIPQRFRRTKYKTWLKILSALQDGNEYTCKAISEKAQLHLDTVRRNVQRLLREGYISQKIEQIASQRRRVYKITSTGRRFIWLEPKLSEVFAFRKCRNKRLRWQAKLTSLIQLVPFLTDLDVKDWSVRAYHSKHLIPVLIPMEPLMDFLGYYLSEGHVRLCKGKRGGLSYIISITNIDPEVRAQVRKCIVDAFGIHPRRIRRDTIGINAKIIYLLLTKLMKIGQNAYTKQFPNFIFSLPNEYKWRLLRAYYRGDGTSEHRTAIKFTTVSKELANQLLFLLMQLQLTGLSIIQEGHFYRIYARDSNIPFEEITDRGLRYNYSLVIPKACLPNGGETIHLKRLKKSVKRDKLIATINELEQSFKGNSHLLGNLRDFAMGDLALDKVIEIRRVKPTKPYVYDLSIDGSENFVAGFGWIAAHNSYGVFGAEHFSLFCPPVAESTAAVGRFAITQTIQKAQSLKIPVLYGDTDSVFLENPSEEQIKNLLSWSEQNLGMELDVDKVYRYSVFSTRKKNYLGVFPDGSVDIKGLTGKKRNTPEFLKKAFSDMVNILSGVKSPEEFEKAREEIKEIVKTCYLKLKRREYTLNDLAFTIVLGKGVDEYRETTPQHVKAAKLLPEEKVQSLGRGDVIRFVKVTGREGVKPVELASLNEIDVDKYMEYVETTFEQVLDALGLDFREILGLTRLEYFMADFNEKP